MVNHQTMKLSPQNRHYIIYINGMAALLFKSKHPESELTLGNWPLSVHFSPMTDQLPACSAIMATQKHRLIDISCHVLDVNIGSLLAHVFFDDFFRGNGNNQYQSGCLMATQFCAMPRHLSLHFRFLISDLSIQGLTIRENLVS